MEIPRKTLVLIGVAFVLGALWISLVRFVIYSPEIVHFHANFALHINGERDQFNNFGFYEEVTQCGGDGEDPARRVHMHDFINNVVHVHDKEVTWIHFFENLRYGLGNTFVKTDAGIFVEDDANELTFILNGDEIRDITGRVINNEDRLLISFGDSSDDELQQQYDSIESSAAEYNQTADPAACSGDAGSGVVDRLKYAFGL